ncbi:MAG: hypothetical protein WC220_10000 [Pedobacter sp.]|jgi:hypothetical protein
MKKAILTIALAGFVTIGFTLVENSKISGYGFVVKPVSSNHEKMGVTTTVSDQRPASWD